MRSLKALGMMDRGASVPPFPPGYRARQTVARYLGRSAGTESEVAPALIRLAWESRAALAIAPLQDVLNLGNEARMNVPGRAGGNWRWRCTDDMLANGALEWLRNLTRRSGRLQGGC